MNNELKYFVVSYGGVGTHMITPMINDSDWLFHIIRDRKKGHLKYPEHIRTVPSSFKEYGYQGKVKLIYIFGDPINSVLSHFRRRLSHKKSWCKHHCLNVQGDFKKFKESWDLKDYLKNGVDLFRLEEHFDNWTTVDPQSIDFDYMILKYETANKHEEQIKDFLNTDVPLNFKMRNSDWRNESEEIKARLVDMYGSLLEKCDQFDEIRIVK
jgi:hypothetical protein